MIKFTYLEDPTRPEEPCTICKVPTAFRAAYEPMPMLIDGKAVKLEKPLCMQCVRRGEALWRLIGKLRELKE